MSPSYRPGPSALYRPVSRPEKACTAGSPPSPALGRPLIWRPHIAYLVLHDECVVQHLLPRNPWTTERFRSVVSAFGLSRATITLCDASVVQTAPTRHTRLALPRVLPLSVNTVRTPF
jgi:hypothetical protein